MGHLDAIQKQWLLAEALGNVLESFGVCSIGNGY